MRRLLPICLLVLALVSTGCGPTRQQRADAEMQQVIASMRAESQTGRYTTRTERAREFQSRARSVYAKYGLTLNSFQELLLSYDVALAGRVDRREITPDEAKYLYDKMKLDLDIEKAKLDAQYQAAEAQRQAAFAQWWNGYQQQQMQLQQQRNLRNPVTCTVTPLGGGSSSVSCY
jgi:hypothetical protein